jgi:glucose/arabinose dehydrogenase
MRNFSIAGVLAIAAALMPHGQISAAVTGMTRVASGLSAPIYITHVPGDQSRLFVVERGGAIKILNLATNTIATTNFLTIPSVITQGEGGLLSMAFHPDYATNGKFYVNVTLANGGQQFLGATSPFSTRIREYTVSSSNPNVANTTPTEILSFIQPQDNHNGGWIGFNPAITPGQPQYLYIPTGDGGNGNDTGAGHAAAGNAQTITNNLLGKILRIDVNSDDFPADVNRNYKIPPTNPYVGVTGDDEIWAIGMRNPFRDSFDRATGDLWLGDVGQGAREEIDRQPANAPGAENFGWRLREGAIETPTSGIGGAIPPNYRAPVYDYDRDADTLGGTVVTGGYVYRGPDVSQQGKYFFLDSRNSNGASDDNYWSFDPANPYGTVTNIDGLLTPNTGSRQFPVSYGEDNAGNLYVAYIGSGEVFRINMAHPVGDYDLDGNIDNDDYTIFQKSFGLTAAGLPADGNNNGTIDAADYVIWRNAISSGSGAGDDAAVPEPTTGIFFAQLSAIIVSFFGMTRRRSIR